MSTLRRRLGIFVIAAAFVVCACGRKHDVGLPFPAPSGAASSELEVLPPRPEAVALADALSVSAARAGGGEGVLLLKRAAQIRQRLWRIDHREADALEALELLREVETKGGEPGCEAALDRVLLQAELRQDLGDAYRQLYVLRLRAPDSRCSARADQAMLTLAAFKPLPQTLAELDREAGADAGGDVAATPSSSAMRDPRGPVVVPTLAGANPGGPVRVTGVERYGAKDAARIVVLLSGPATFNVGYLKRENPQRGPRLYVDIHRAQYRGQLAYDVGGLVQRVRMGKQKTDTRVVLDLAGDVYRKVFYLPEPFRLVIDVSTEPPRTEQVESGRRRPVRRVVLDPGHGGHDPGAIGPSGLAEKDVTLDIAHRTAPLIARELGIATLLTRDADVYVPLDERTARANAFQADLFVSIHCNAAEDPCRAGVMTFVLDESGDAWASNIAARENAASPAAAAELANAMSQVQDVDNVARCVRFAELLQRASAASLQTGYADVPNRGVRRAGFYVLAGAHMPAVLFEVSFISHPVGEARLNTADYRQKLADSIVNAVRAYRDGH